MIKALPRLLKRALARLSRRPAAQGPALADFFDADWYRTQRPDLASVENPIAHYLSEGADQGLNPHPLFHTTWYLEHNPDVAAAGTNPLLHYVSAGAMEGRSPCAYFSAPWYVHKYPIVRVQDGGALRHYMTTGFRQGCNPNPYFDTVWYLKTYPEVADYPRDPLTHFVQIGEAAGYRPGPGFDPKWYLLRNPDVAKWPGTPFTHYVLAGAREERTAVRGPYDFADEQALARLLAAPVVSQESVAGTLELPLASVESLVATPEGGQRVFQAAERSAQGVTTPLAPYPGLPYVAKVENALALGGTRYLASRGHIRHDEMAAFRDVKDAAVKYRHAHLDADGKVMLDFLLKPANWVEAGIDLMHEYSNNYFHFVVETLPRMILAEEAQLPASVPYLVERTLHNNMLQLLELANTPGRPILPMESETMYRVGTLFYPSDVSSVVDSYEAGEANRLSVLDVPRIRAAVERCKAHFPAQPGGRGRRIYVGRSGGLRQLTNQQELEAALAARGFEIMRTENLDIPTQIAIFREAEVIVAPTGAQLTNMVWAEPGAQVIVLASDHPSHQLYLWELLGRVSQARVSCVLGPRAFVRDDKYSVHDDYSIDVQKILDQI